MLVTQRKWKDWCVGWSKMDQYAYIYTPLILIFKALQNLAKTLHSYQQQKYLCYLQDNSTVASSQACLKGDKSMVWSAWFSKCSIESMPCMTFSVQRKKDEWQIICYLATSGTQCSYWACGPVCSSGCWSSSCQKGSCNMQWHQCCSLLHPIPLRLCAQEAK